MVVLLQLDAGLRTWIVLHRVGALDYVMAALSEVGRGGLIFLGIGAILMIRRRLKALELAQLALAILVASALANLILKPAVGRDRPFLQTSEAAVIGEPPTDASFPSGHTAEAFAAAVVLTRFVPGVGAVWWLLAVSIGYSRVYLGVHYPLDVLAGAFLGMAVAAALLSAFRQITRM
jgi:undecaprenyl-diphosphatase